MSSDKIAIRSEQPGDYEAIDEIVSAAFLAEFATTTEAARIRTMRERGQLVGDLALVAEQSGSIVGHIASKPCWFNTPDHSPDECWA